MELSDQSFDRALLYLRAAGHDTGAETRSRLHAMLQTSQSEQKALSTSQLLEQIPRWFDLPGSTAQSRLPPIARGSIGYPGE